MNNINKKYISLLIFLAACLLAKAQPSFTVSDKETAAELKKGTLCVVIKGKDEKQMKRLAKKPDELKEYEAGIDSFNVFLKRAVEREWDISKIKFIAESEAEQLKETKANGQFLLEITEVTNYKMNDFYRLESSITKNPALLAQSLAYHMAPSGGTVALAIAPASKPNRELVLSYLPAIGVCPASVTFMVLHLENQIVDSQKGVNSVSDIRDAIDKREASLKSKTLILFEPMIGKHLQKVIDEKELSKYYTYPCEVVTFERASEIITQKDSKYAYVWAVPAGAITGGRVIFNYFIMDAADARPVFLTGTGVAEPGKFHQKQLEWASKRSKE